MGDRSTQLDVREPKRGGLARKVVKLAIVLAALGAVVGIGLGVSSNKKDTPPTEVPPVKVTAIPVVTEPTLADTFELPAVVEPNKVIEVSAEGDGKIEWIGPQKGSLVRKGEPLIRLNTELLQAEFQMAQAQAKNNQTEFDRIKGLVEKGAAPSRDMDAAATQLVISKAQLEQARIRLARASIAAPMAGVLNDVPVEVGEYVTLMPRTTVAEIVDTSVVKVAVEIPERDVPFLSVGQQTAVIADNKGCEVSLTGTTTFISQVADARTRCTRMEITVPNQEGCLRSGQIVHVRLTRQILKDAILIPLAAVIPMEDGKAVYVVESSQAQRRRVELGLIRGDRVQIRSGLKPGDRLIVAGHRFVGAGQKVEVVPESKTQP
ncbi:MAG: efflux RND transporter periplasmic adaptor subunit [Planctomycetes bacterium]|nr:efflux RND transporter periplasmic adaptor subunit [Planctomycetota bacterium]